MFSQLQIFWMFHVQLMFDIYHEPTHSFSHLHYHSCHSQYTKNNIVLSLGQRIIRIVCEIKEKHLNKLKFCLLQHSHPEEVLDYTIIKPFSVSFESLYLFESLQNLLIRAPFHVFPKPIAPPKNIGLYNCQHLSTRWLRLY